MDEMQCIWFQMEMALAFRRIGKLGDALQKLHEIDKVSGTGTGSIVVLTHYSCVSLPLVSLFLSIRFQYPVFNGAVSMVSGFHGSCFPW